MSDRTDRVNQLIQAELAPVVEVYTQELGGLVTITYVKVSPDLANAYVGVSCFNTLESSENVIEVLNRHSSLFHREIAKRLQMRRIPKLEFRDDQSGKYVQKIDQLFYQIKEERQKNEEKHNIDGDSLDDENEGLNNDDHLTEETDS